MKRLLLIILTLTFNCNLYYTLITDKVEFNNSFASKDESVISLLQAIADNDQEKIVKYTFSRAEYFTIYHPSIREFPSIVSKMTAEEAWPMVELKHKISLDKLRQRLTGKTISKVEYMYRKGRPESMRLGNLILWMPDAIRVTFTDGTEDIIEQISTIAENHGRFKVAALKTG